MRMNHRHVSVCSVEKLKQRLQDADENTIDLGQDTVIVTPKTPKFDRDVLKSITVTVQQHRGTQMEEEEEGVRPGFISHLHLAVASSQSVNDVLFCQLKVFIMEQKKRTVGPSTVYC